MYLVGNGLLVTRDEERPLVENGAVAVNGDLISRIGTTEELRELFPEAEFIDARGGIIMPGMIDAHSHLANPLLRLFEGEEPMTRGRAAAALLEKTRLDAAVAMLDCSNITRVSALSCLRHGVTTVFDLSEICWERPGTELATAGSAAVAGLRICASAAITSRSTYDVCTALLADNEDMLAYLAKADEKRCTAAYGLYSPSTLSDLDLDRCMRGKPQNAGIHAIVSDDPADDVICSRRYGKTSTERLYDRGMINDKAILAHCTCVSESDMDLIKSAGAFVAHVPYGDLMSGAGTAPVGRMLEKGIPVCLGTDGLTDPLEAARIAIGVRRTAEKDPLLGAGFAAEMLFGANAALVRKYFGKEIGRLREGATADIAVMDFRPFGNPDAAKLDEQMITMMSGADCRLTMVDGMIVMRDGKIIRTNESGVRERAEKSIVNIWKILHHIEEEPDDWECED